MNDTCLDRNLNITAIIPAYNEAKNILNVLQALKEIAAIKEIIVVSDGSVDKTAAIVRKAGGVNVIELPKNVGKTKAVLHGVAEAEHPILLLCDADLISLEPKHLSDLIEKYKEGMDMVIMDKGSQPWVFRKLFKSVPAVSGTRIMDKCVFANIPFLETDRFQLEIRINDYYLANGLSIAVTPAHEVHDPRKFNKYAFWNGVRLDIKGGLEVLASDGPASILKNLTNFRKIKALSDIAITKKRR